MSPVSSKVDRPAAPEHGAPAPSREDPGARTSAEPVGATRDARRLAIARAVVGLLGRAIADPGALAIVLDEGGPASTARDGGGRHRPGAATVDGAATRSRVILHGPDAIGRLGIPPSADGFAEAYLRGDVEIEGDVMAAIAAGQALDIRRLGARHSARLLRWAWALRRGTTTAAPLDRVARIGGRRHSRARDMEAVRFHYDVGNDFYALWLDRRLAYSCAYFPDGTTPSAAAERLDAAQDAKLELIVRKLRLTGADRLLDIGSGWGSLVNFAAERHGARAVGVTLSERQASVANARAHEAGLGDLARSVVLDYRDLDGLGAFDAVASVGMFEHVGRANLPVYFRAAYEALRPGGLFLNHGIATAETRRSLGPLPLGALPLGRLPLDRLPLAARNGRFIDRYVFPDGELVPVEEAIAVARAAGFEVVDVQSLRAHYALTLAAWIARLEARWDEAVAAAGAEVARTWRLYMSGARLGFERGEIDVCQLLLARPGPDGPAGLPLRPWW